MKRYIHIARTDRAFIEKAFRVTGRTIDNALRFDERRGNSDTAKRIRKIALERGGVVMVVSPEVETMHDYDGVISQYFPNGAKIEIDKETGSVSVYYRGDAVATFEDVRFDRLQHIQGMAAALNKNSKQHVTA